jgi:hypothetical protein
MEFIKDFFDTLYSAGIDLEHLDAIHDIAKMDKISLECRAFEEWYAKNVYSEDA